MTNGLRQVYEERVKGEAHPCLTYTAPCPPNSSSSTNTTTSTGGTLGHDSRRSNSTSSDVDMDAPVLSFWGPEPVPLPSRFARIKRNLIQGHEAALEARINGW